MTHHTVTNAQISKKKYFINVKNGVIAMISVSFGNVGTAKEVFLRSTS